MLHTSAQRTLAVARILGVSAIALVAEIAVDMPEGYFGGQDTITRFGLGYALATLLLGGATILAGRRRHGAASWLAPAVFSLHIGLFVPALPADPLVAGCVVLWNLVLLTLHFAPRRPGARLIEAGADEVDLWLDRNQRAVQHLSLLSLALTLAVVGYRLSGLPMARAVCLTLGHATMVAGWRFLALLARRGHRAVYVAFAAQAASLLASPRPVVALGLLAIAHGFLVAFLLAQRRTTREILHYFYTHPSRLVVLTFAATILAGAVLLTFPAASAHATAIAPLDALFTATSATCVTGLIVLDTAADFSRLGQIAILVLIQIGGLGIMTLSTFGALLLGGTLGLRGEYALAQVLERPSASEALRLTRFIVLSTLGIEAIGAAGLTLCFSAAGMGWKEAVWRGVFHSVSAFCNAGFALQSDSLVIFQDQPLALALVATLIVLGGLGFVVIAAVAGRLLGPRRPLPVQARIVLAATVLLLVGGFVLYALAEWNRSLAGLPVGAKLINAFFQSATLRTAGFNSVGFGLVGPATVLFMMTFMFIGASPGSTAGGIKTTTAAVLLAAVRSAVRGNQPISLFRREIPADIVQRSLVIAAVSAVTLAAGVFLLLLFEDQPFADLLFEAISAFGTVGLSLGATARLAPPGKLIVTALMFVGRIGSLTLALLLGSERRAAERYRYPEARIMVG